MDSRWKGLSRVGGAAALISAVFIPIQVIVFVATPPPTTVVGWFTLFHNNRLVVSNPAFEMLSLSGQYAAVTTDAQRSTLLAAGQAMLAAWQGTAFQVGYVLGSVAGVAIGAVMLRSSIFGQMAAYMGILANAIGLGLYVPTIGVYIAVFSVVFLEIWYILIARRLFRLR